jgi:Subtilase family
MSDDDRRRHIVLEGNGRSEAFTSPNSPPRADPNPERDRQAHANALLAQVASVKADMNAVAAERAARGVREQEGLVVEFEAATGFELALDSLEARAQGVELLAVRATPEMRATAFIPHGKLGWLERRIEGFRDRDTDKGAPKYAKLVSRLAAIREAALRSFWTDDDALFPEDGMSIWWEVWLRAGRDRQSILDSFRHYAGLFGLGLKPDAVVKFIDRSVVLAWGPPEAMRESVHLLDCIAELRKAKELAGEFLELPAADQREFASDLGRRITVTRAEPPAVCLLDSGLNAHPLLDDFVKLRDTALAPSLGVGDRHGHGTQMAGVALFGDGLAAHLVGSAPVSVDNVIESVKLWQDGSPTDPDLYGHLTAQAACAAEARAPQRLRAFCLPVTARDSRDRGAPSSWSAALDALIGEAIEDEGHARLVAVSAGNVADALWRQGPYPEVNLADGVHDPGQAWNALTVGGFTDLCVLDPRRFLGWTPVAPAGALSPTSTTSVNWNDSWPLKPEVVFEGGNVAIDPATGEADTADDVRLLTTYRDPALRWFTTTGDTSAAAAQAARVAALVWGEYPELWPETVRALLVHSAEWTNAMLERELAERLRCYGYGVPDLELAMWSARDHLTLVVQDELSPFRKDGSDIKTNQMNVHDLPWPREALEDLGSTEVELRVTLSYFVEPNPARRGWRSRFVYPSHQLRFDVRRALETSAAFRERINKEARDEDFKRRRSSDSNWDLGRTMRHKGSIHRDSWRGTARDLAARGVLAVYPASGGWWRSRPAENRWHRPARYALIVSVHTPAVATEVDVYTPVANAVSAAIPVAVTNQ